MGRPRWPKKKDFVPVTGFVPEMSGAYVFSNFLDPQSGDRYLKVGIWGPTPISYGREGARNEMVWHRRVSEFPEVVHAIRRRKFICNDNGRLGRSVPQYLNQPR